MAKKKVENGILLVCTLEEKQFSALSSRHGDAVSVIWTPSFHAAQWAAAISLFANRRNKHCCALN